MKPRLSIAMIVKDGAETLGRSLASVAYVADQIIFGGLQMENSGP
jgi:hypothetical protein